MLKKCLAISIAFSFGLLQSCNESKGYKKNENGLRYKILRDSAGKTGELGGFMLINFEIKNNKDSVLQSTFKSGGPVPMEIQKPLFKGAVEEGLTLLSQGDSAAFLVSSDSLFKPNAELPPGVAKNSDLQFTVKVVKLFSKAEVEKEKEKAGKQQEEQRQEAFKQLAIDTVKIKDHIKTNKIKIAGKSENGVYYTVTSKGKGEQLKPGDSLSVNYVGKLLDGKEFDSGKDFPIVLGVSQVIVGWHEGISQLKDGDKATLYIPSPLGYGKQGAGSIPPDAILTFDVEVSKK